MIQSLKDRQEEMKIRWRTSPDEQIQKYVKHKEQLDFAGKRRVVVSLLEQHSLLNASELRSISGINLHSVKKILRSIGKENLISKRGKFCGGYIQTEKGGNFYCRSSFERYYIRFLEENPFVERFEYEPIRIAYISESGYKKKYVPDFMLYSIRTKKFLVEVKPKCFLDCYDNPRKFAAAEGWCAENNAEFIIVTDLTGKFKNNGINKLMEDITNVTRCNDRL
jgi:hypothetical protein